MFSPYLHVQERDDVKQLSVLSQNDQARTQDFFQGRGGAILTRVLRCSPEDRHPGRRGYTDKKALSKRNDLVVTVDVPR